MISPDSISSHRPGPGSPGQVLRCPGARPGLRGPSGSRPPRLRYSPALDPGAQASCFSGSAVHARCTEVRPIRPARLQARGLSPLHSGQGLRVAAPPPRPGSPGTSPRLGPPRPFPPVRPSSEPPSTADPLPASLHSCRALLGVQAHPRGPGALSPATQAPGVGPLPSVLGDQMGLGARGPAASPRPPTLGVQPARLPSPLTAPGLAARAPAPAE